MIWFRTPKSIEMNYKIELVNLKAICEIAKKELVYIMLKFTIQSIRKSPLELLEVLKGNLGGFKLKLFLIVSPFINPRTLNLF